MLKHNFSKVVSITTDLNCSFCTSGFCSPCLLRFSSVSQVISVLSASGQYLTIYHCICHGISICHSFSSNVRVLHQFVSLTTECPRLLQSFSLFYHRNCVTHNFIKAVWYFYFNLIQCLSQISQVVAFFVSHKDSKSELDLLREQVKAEVGPPV